MITLYTWTTPNGRKASIMLEETGLTYAAKPVNIGKGEQFAPDFLAVSPNNKIPAIVDEEGVDQRTTVFETGAILIHLAEKAGMLLPSHGHRRDETLEWLFWSVSGLAPMLGQWNHFANRAEVKTPAAITRFAEEGVRLLKVLEGRLGRAVYLAEDYSIADVSTYPWVSAIIRPFRDQLGDGLGPTPNIDRWLAELAARPAVQRGMLVPEV